MPRFLKVLKIYQMQALVKFMNPLQKIRLEWPLKKNDFLNRLKDASENPVEEYPYLGELEDDQYIYYEPKEPNFDSEKREQIKELLGGSTSTYKEFETNAKSNNWIF